LDGVANPVQPQNIVSTQAVVFKETPAGSIAKEIPTDSLGIDDENFWEIAEKLFNEKLELVENLRFNI
jgi:hypothetical protein